MLNCPNCGHSIPIEKLETVEITAEEIKALYARVRPRLRNRRQYQQDHPYLRDNGRGGHYVINLDQREKDRRVAL